MESKCPINWICVPPPHACAIMLNSVSSSFTLSLSVTFRFGQNDFWGPAYTHLCIGVSVHVCLWRMLLYVLKLLYTYTQKRTVSVTRPFFSQLNIWVLVWRF